MSDEPYQEIWIPSKTRIRDKLIESLKISLMQSGPSKEAAFMVWLESNAAALNYLGKEHVSVVVLRVAEDLKLEVTSQGYIKWKE